jgi:molecular chaperone DnaJ
MGNNNGKNQTTEQPMKTCTACNGSGTKKSTCSTCAGRGFIPTPVRPFTPIECKTCDGTGEVSSTCSTCGGSGQVPA